jgi:hypothetical protein
MCSYPLIIKAVVLLVGAIVTVLVGGPIVGAIVRGYAPQLEEDAGLLDGGRIIGICERLLVLSFVLSATPQAIGLLVTAKSIFRFEDVTGESKRKHSEYVIIGTLVSFAYAVTVSYGIKWMLDHGVALICS